MTDDKAVSDTIVIRSPSTEEESEQASVLLSDLKAWDVRQSEALGFDPDEVIGIFYTDAIGDSRQESTPPTGCLLLATDARRPVGLAAYRQLTSNACELYNVYVSPVWSRLWDRITAAAGTHEQREVGGIPNHVPGNSDERQRCGWNAGWLTEAKSQQPAP
jgi:hypothetical protein